MPKPSVHVAPVGVLKVYEVTEDELDRLAHGNPSSEWLAYALALLGALLGILATMLSSQLSDRNLTIFVSVEVILGLFGTFSLVRWLRTRDATAGLVARIKARMPPTPGEQVT